MRNFVRFGKKLERLFSQSRTQTARLPWSFSRVLVFRANPFCVQLIYFLIVSLLGYLALKVSKPRSSSSSRPKDIDVFFTSVSASAVSSMSTVEMEVFSNSQLIIITILMLVGGEVFTSMLGLQFSKLKFLKQVQTSEDNKMGSVVNGISSDRIEQDLVSHPGKEQNYPKDDIESNVMSLGRDGLRYNSIRYLSYVVLGYLLVVHMVGSSLVSTYVGVVPSAREVLKTKGIQIQTFSVFTVVSTFSNCGFLPTNENMMVFKKNSGLLLLLIPQILMGNTLYPVCLRILIWVLEKITKRMEFSYMLKNYGEIGYGHLLSGVHSALLAVTALGFILVQFILFCSMEWNNSDAMDGLNPYQKLVGSLFEVVNSRHTGEFVFDISIISSAILVLFVLMMYLPPYTSFLPRKYQEITDSSENGKEERHLGLRKSFWECMIFSQLSYVVIFIILVCITEREKIKEDPLNFSVLNITIEVISAYGNVGFSTGYSCKRQLKPDSSCKDAYIGFVGRWSTLGKLVLVIVMFFGRLKKFSMEGGKAWKLS